MSCLRRYPIVVLLQVVAAWYLHGWLNYLRNDPDFHGNVRHYLKRYKGFLGPRGPLVLPSMGPVRPALKIWITYIQAYMPHESSGDSSNQPDGPMGSPRRLP